MVKLFFSNVHGNTLIRYRGNGHPEGLQAENIWRDESGNVVAICSLLNVNFEQCQSAAYQGLSIQEFEDRYLLAKVRFIVNITDNATDIKLDYGLGWEKN
jgi:hypothetical protein